MESTKTSPSPLPLSQRERGEHTAVARFGPFELDPERGELHRGGERINLQEQPARILAVLLCGAGRLVTRDELREAIWPADTFVDFDHGLNTAVRKLRLALGDTADAPRYVETVARHGYRFVAPVEWIDAVDHASGAGARRVRSIVAAIAVVALGVAAAVVVVRGRAADPVRPIRNIAVLPFENADPSTAHVSDGIAEALIRRLSVSATLRVTAPSSSMVYKGQAIDPRAVGAELGVDALVTGSLERLDGDYAVRVELVETAGGTQVWGGEYRQPPDRIGLLQRSMMWDLSYRLGLTQADTSHMQRESPAYELYLRGRHHWNQRSRWDHLQAIECFERAIELDPEFALAYAGLGTAYGTLVGNNLLPGSEDEIQRKSIAAIDRALSLDPTLAEAWASQAARKAGWDRDFEGAERDFLRAIELNPSYASAHQWYAGILWSIGRMEDSRREIDLAHSIDPFSEPIAAYRCWNRMIDRRYEEAIEVAGAFNRARARPPGQCAIWSQILLGDYEKSLEMIDANHRYWRGDDQRAVRLAEGFARGGVPEFWNVWIEYVPAHESYLSAVAFAMSGRVDEAFAHLERSYESRDAVLNWMYVDPRLDNLRSDPRFDELARRIGLPRVVEGRSESSASP